MMCGMRAACKAILRFGRTVKIQAPAGAVADPDCGQYHLCHAIREGNAQNRRRVPHAYSGAGLHRHEGKTH